jgi:hypothetical protein
MLNGTRLTYTFFPPQNPVAKAPTNFGAVWCGFPATAGAMLLGRWIRRPCHFLLNNPLLKSKT